MSYEDWTYLMISQYVAPTALWIIVLMLFGVIVSIGVGAIRSVLKCKGE